MTKKLPYTPNSQIKSALRQLFLRSRERAACIKECNNTCQTCGVKGTTAKGRQIKVQVHHRRGIDNWPALYQAIRDYLLNGKDMVVLCETCHSIAEAYCPNCVNLTPPGKCKYCGREVNNGIV